MPVATPVVAAWPPIYAASFSGFYLAMFLVLATLILRPVGFEFRNKMSDERWRTFWDYALFAGGLVPSVVFGCTPFNMGAPDEYILVDELMAVAKVHTIAAFDFLSKA